MSHSLITFADKFSANHLVCTDTASNNLSSDEPSYLRSLLFPNQPARNLQSSTLNLLTVTSPRTNLSSRAFRHSATAIWNNLPAVIRSANSRHVYKRRLKTHLLSLAFNTELTVVIIVL